MTDVVEELLAKYQVRKTRAQKTAFIAFLCERYPELAVEENGLFKSRNLVAGNPDSARLILTAHYDTCAALPFPNFLTPKNLPVYLLYQLAVFAPILAVVFLVSFAIGRWTQNPGAAFCVGIAACVLLFLPLFAGKANPHTANDNTSGVAVLCCLLDTMDEEMRRRTAFVFFDHEEIGLIGSAQFRKKHRAGVERALVVNLDCVADGDTIMIILNKRARRDYGNALRRAFDRVEDKEVRFEKSSVTLYPSDQIQFPCNAAVAAFHRHCIFGYYLSRIHTSRDTCFDERNIAYLSKSLRALAYEITD